jgi:hypothetical protein
MSEALILEFSGVTAEEYREVNGHLGIDPDTGAGDWPAGLVSHVGCRGTNLLVLEVWESQEAQHAFMETRLGPALGKAGLPEPVRMEWMTLLGQHNA